MRLSKNLVDWLAAQAETVAKKKFVFDPAQKSIATMRQADLSASSTILRTV